MSESTGSMALNLPGAKMQDIATRLQLSVATVSRALRRVPGINPETRARVMQVAGEIGYELPPANRSGGSGNELRHIGVFMETKETGANSPYLTGMSEACMSLNASLVMHYVKPGECESLLDPKFEPRAMRSGLLSGIILIYWWPREVVDALSRKLPTVSVMHRYTGVDIDVVGIDNSGGMSALMRELYNHGHRKIGFLGRCGLLHWANARFGGYVASLAELDLEYDPRLVIDADYDTMIDVNARWEAYLPQAERLVREEGVTAWVCASEPAGWRLHEYLGAQGLNVPEDVSITGFHRPTGPAMGPDLTSVGSSYEAIGAAALRRLLFRIQNPGESSRNILFPCEFYRGKTVGQARFS